MNKLIVKLAYLPLPIGINIIYQVDSPFKGTVETESLGPKRPLDSIDTGSLKMHLESFFMNKYRSFDIKSVEIIECELLGHPIIENTENESPDVPIFVDNDGNDDETDAA